MKLYLFIISLLFTVHVIYGQNNQFKENFKNAEPQLDKRIQGLMKSKNVKGISIALVDSSSTIWSKGYGFSDYEAKTPVDKKTIFCFASISKLFTSIAIMQLQQQGKLDINKSVQTYIPEFKPLGSEEFLQSITIKSVLMHQSGLPSDNYSLFFTNKPFSDQKIIDYLNTQYVCTKPYTISSYSNIGYCLLGAIVERVSGKAFNDYVKENITMPLGMKNTSFILEEHMKPLLSKQYFKGNKEYIEQQNGEQMPAGGLLSNIEDMTFFAQMLLNKGTLGNVQIISTSTFNEMTTPQNTHVNRDYDMVTGLTFFLTMDGTWYKAGGSISHGGNTIVFHSGLTILPYQNMAIIISANSKNGVSVVQNIERFVLEKALEVKGIDTLFPKQIISKPQQKIYLQPHDYKKFEGNYSFVSKTMKLKARKSSLILKYKPIAFKLSPNNDSTFSVRMRILGISFKNKNISKMWFDIEGPDTIIVLTSWDRNFYMSNKIHSLSDNDYKKWKFADGSYIRSDSANILSTLEIKVKRDYIYLLPEKYGNYKLQFTALPLNDSMLKVTGLGRYKGDVFTITKEKGKIYLHCSGITYCKE